MFKSMFIAESIIFGDSCNAKRLAGKTRCQDVMIWNILSKKIPSNLKLHITLYETSNNFVEYEGNHW